MNEGARDENEAMWRQQVLRLLERIANAVEDPPSLDGELHDILPSPDLVDTLTEESSGYRGGEYSAESIAILSHERDR